MKMLIFVTVLTSTIVSATLASPTFAELGLAHARNINQIKGQLAHAVQNFDPDGADESEDEDEYEMEFFNPIINQECFEEWDNCIDEYAKSEISKFEAIISDENTTDEEKQAAKCGFANVFKNSFLTCQTDCFFYLFIPELQSESLEGIEQKCETALVDIRDEVETCEGSGSFCKIFENLPEPTAKQKECLDAYTCLTEEYPNDPQTCPDLTLSYGGTTCLLEYFAKCDYVTMAGTNFAENVDQAVPECKKKVEELGCSDIYCDGLTKLIEDALAPLGPTTGSASTNSAITGLVLAAGAFFINH